jgi:phospholipid/cholesterol/gamma-HCH transport system ATP-binding protein
MDSRVIFRGLNFQIRKGEAFFILGTSGSGKSLLIRMCAGLVFPDEGSVGVRGTELATASKEMLQRLRTGIGYVSQGSGLISNMAAYDNVALPLRYHTGLDEAEVGRKVEEKMALFGVDRDFDRSIPAQLSLEMQKKVALARAFVLDPELLLLDQPTSGLDSGKGQALATVIREYQREKGASLLEVSSEWPPFGPPFDRNGVLEGGRVGAEGSAEEIQAYIERTKKTELLVKE